MPEPISATLLPPSALPETSAPSGPPAPPALESVYDGVSAMVDASGAPACATTPGAPTAGQLDALLDVYRDGGGAGLHAFLAGRRDVRAAVGRLAPEQLECALVARDPGADDRSLLPPWRTEAERVVSEVELHYDGLVHSLTLQEGQAAVREALSQLDLLEANLPSRLEALRGAAPGTPEAALASMLGIRGGVVDPELAQERIDQARAALESFVDRLAGQTWTQSDFPAASRRALEAIGVGGAPRGSIADLAAGESPSGFEDAVSTVLNLVHLGIAGAEATSGLGRLVMRSVVAGAIRQIPAVGIALVIDAQLHHLEEENHAKFVATGRLLGM